MHAFAPLVAFLRLEAQRRDRPRVQPLQRDRLAGRLAIAVLAVVDTPQRGVVDRNQRVFGIANLYIGGSSVFATSGHVNPTFTIVQMSLRLADHLDGTIRGSKV